MTKKHTVKAGECISSISAKYGFLWEIVWDAPKNSELKALRQDPNVLFKGDIVVIPDIEKKLENCPAGAKHDFVVKGVPAKIKFKFQLDDEPFTNAPFSLIIDGEFAEEGQSDDSGFIAASIPPSAKECKVILGPPEDRHLFNLVLGTLDPIDTNEGAMKRLFNLGYGVDGDVVTAINKFQKSQDLPETKILDDTTRSKIKEVFGQ